jgi:NB-ARC domain
VGNGALVRYGSCDRRTDVARELTDVARELKEALRRGNRTRQLTVPSFTPRSWKSQAEPQAVRPAEPPVSKFHAYRHGKPNNLPIASTTFVGRERDVVEVKELLERHRLVTLVGAGGIGKTRLAVQVGTELLDRFREGAWFADLAPIADSELVSSVIAQALGMSQQQGQRVDEAIPQWLKHKHLLLIFDNCEHVIETVAPIAAAILRTAPNVRIVATSRQGLNVDGEAAHRVPSLAVPEAAAGLKLDETLKYGAAGRDAEVRCGRALCRSR